MVYNELPEGWKWVKLSQICEVVTGNTPPKSDKDNYGDIYPFYKPPHLWDCSVSESEEMLSQKGSSKARLVPENTVLVTCIGNLGRTGFTKKEAAFNQQINAILENEDIIGKYIFYSAQSPTFRNQLEELATGTTVSIVNKSNFQTIKISLPSNKESQQAIVSKIEELFSELDKGVENLKTAQQQLKVYRQSVLKWAFEGKLTSLNHDSLDLSDAHDLAMVAEPQAIYESKKHHGNQEYPKNHGADNEGLPVGWKFVTIDKFLIEKKGMGTGPFGTMLKKSEHMESGIPVLGIENIGEGKFQMPNKIFVTSEKAKELKSFRVKENDVIISRSGTVGEICLLPKSMEHSIISTNLIRVSLNQNIINPKYFVYLFQGGKVRQDVYLLCKGSSRAFLNQTILKSLSFPLCSLKEQVQVVEEIESRLSVADKMEETIQQSLLQAESLRQSILKKAFEGGLVR